MGDFIPISWSRSVTWNALDTSTLLKESVRIVPAREPTETLWGQLLGKAAVRSLAVSQATVAEARFDGWRRPVFLLDENVRFEELAGRSLSPITLADRDPVARVWDAASYASALADASDGLSAEFAAWPNNAAAGHSRRLAISWSRVVADTYAHQLPSAGPPGVVDYARMLRARERFRYLVTFRRLLHRRAERERALEDAPWLYGGAEPEADPAAEGGVDPDTRRPDVDDDPPECEIHAAPRETRAGPPADGDEGPEAGDDPPRGFRAGTGPRRPSTAVARR